MCILFVNENMSTSFKNYNELLAHYVETRSRAINKLVPPWHSKSKCLNALIFRGIKLPNTNPNGIEQSTNLARFKKFLEHFILNSSEDPD